MAEQLQDGRGTGQLAQVDDHGRLYVLANTVSHPAHHASYHKDFFYSHHTTSVPGTSTETNVALVQGVSSSIELELHSVLFASDQNMLVRVYFDSLYSSGGDTVTARNSNRTSNKTLDVGLYQGGAGADLVLDETNKMLTAVFYVQAYVPFLYPVDGTVILGNDKSLHFTAEAASAATLYITMGLAPHAQGVKL